jgi:hypothetical protein
MNRVLATLIVLLIAGGALLVAHTLSLRYERDVSRMVFNDNLQLLDLTRRRLGAVDDSLHRLSDSRAELPVNSPYLVVSIADHRLWYRQGDSVLFTAEVATGSGRVLERSDGHAHWRFETPRGRLQVVSKETDPVWVAPDWHYVEEAQRRGLGVARLQRGQRLPLPDGGWIAVAGADLVRLDSDGRRGGLAVEPGRELVAGGNIVIPPYGTNQRKYRGVLGSHRINLGNGYALHGTNQPESIGRSVSHGCIRLRNEDISELYGKLSIGTPIFIY